jgi:hypothetical protein
LDKGLVDQGRSPLEQNPAERRAAEAIITGALKGLVGRAYRVEFGQRARANTDVRSTVPLQNQSRLRPIPDLNAEQWIKAPPVHRGRLATIGNKIRSQLFVPVRAGRFPRTKSERSKPPQIKRLRMMAK